MLHCRYFIAHGLHIEYGYSQDQIYVDFKYQTCFLLLNRTIDLSTIKESKLFLKFICLKKKDGCILILQNLHIFFAGSVNGTVHYLRK